MQYERTVRYCSLSDAVMANCSIRRGCSNCQLHDPITAERKCSQRYIREHPDEIMRLLQIREVPNWCEEQ